MRTRLIILLCVFIPNIIYLDAQGQSLTNLENLVELAKKNYLNKEFSQSIKCCNEILSVEPDSYIAHLLLAEIYNDLDSIKPEIFHLNKASDNSNDTTIFFKLGEAHYKTGNYSKALTAYNQYSNYKYIPEKRQFLLACKIASCQVVIHSLKKQVEFYPGQIIQQESASLDEYWPDPSPDGKDLVFTQLLNESGQLLDNDIYTAEIDSVNWDQKIPKGETDATLENEDADSRIIFFTACGRSDGMGNCDIYYSRFENNKWSTPTNAGDQLNSEYWDAQPSFSADNRSLYFSSDRTGGEGGKDIWKAELSGFSDSGKPIWKEPKNLGNGINTPGNELSPLIYSNNNNLYFSSDSHVGMGGLDLFVAELDNSGSVNEIKNLGYPTNTNEDELGVYISVIAGTTYFSACRNTNTGVIIFTFNYLRGLSPELVNYVKLNVRDANSKLPIQAKVEVVNLSYQPNKYQFEEVGKNGELMLCLPTKRNYRLNISEPGFLFYTESLVLNNPNSLKEPYIIDVELKPIEVGAEMELYNIYYALDSYTILPTSKQELQKLISFMEKNKKVKIEIQGHTDNTGNPQNNMELSLSRAKSVVEYLVANKIELSRLKFIGYGDTRPIESNDTESGRQLNRRTTVKILDN